MDALHLFVKMFSKDTIFEHKSLQVTVTDKAVAMPLLETNIGLNTPSGNSRQELPISFQCAITQQTCINKKESALISPHLQDLR